MMNKFYTVATILVKATAKKPCTVENKVNRCNRDNKLVGEIEAYLNRKLAKYDLTVSGFQIETDIDKD
jgi:hypothetical protein